MDDTGSATSSNESPQSSSSNMWVIIAVVFIIFLLGIGGYYVMSKKTVTSSTMAPTVTPTPANAITSIQDALSKSVSLQCDYTDNSGVSTTAYIKSGTIRTDTKGKTAETSSSMIMKDKKLYVWTGKKGFIMAFDITSMMKAVTPSITVKPSTMQPSPSTQNGQNIIGDLEKFKQNCKPATVSDALFVIPTDVTFSDMSKMMPSGSVPQGSMNQEQMQQIQKQMMQATVTPSQ